MAYKINWAYIAGWMDGDGFISPKTKRVGIELIDEEVVKTFAKIFESNYYPRHRKRKYIKNLKTTYQTSINGVRAISFLKKVYPFLMEKTKKVEEYFKLYKEYLPRNLYLDHTKSQFMDYLTGFFEAEGCLNIRENKTGGGGASVTFSNTNKSLIYFLKRSLEKYHHPKIKIYERVKGQSSLRREDGTFCNRKALYQFTLNDLHAHALLLNVSKFGICLRKRSKAKKALKFLEEKIEALEVGMSVREYRKALSEGKFKF